MNRCVNCGGELDASWICMACGANNQPMKMRHDTEIAPGSVRQYDTTTENSNRLVQVRNPRSGRWYIINKDTGEIIDTADEREEGIEVAGESD